MLDEAKQAATSSAASNVDQSAGQEQLVGASSKAGQDRWTHIAIGL